MLAIKEKTNCDDAAYIEDFHYAEFTEIVLASYYAHVKQIDFPVLPFAFHDLDDGEFYEAYYEAYQFILNTISIRSFGLTYKDLEEHQTEELDQDIATYWPQVEEGIFNDIQMILDHNQLFYIRIESPGYDEPVSEIEYRDMFNTPLQTVW